MLKSGFIGLALILSIPAAFGVTKLYQDERGDLRVKDPLFADLDIQTVKVSTPDRKNFVFEIKTKGIPVSTPENPIYYVVAVNEDGDFKTGHSMWIGGPEVSRFIYLEGSTVKRITSQWADTNPLGEATLDKETLKISLTLNTKKAKFISFGVYIILKKPRADGKGPYTILDAATATLKNETYQFEL